MMINSRFYLFEYLENKLNEVVFEIQSEHMEGNVINQDYDPELMMEIELMNDYLVILFREQSNS